MDSQKKYYIWIWKQLGWEVDHEIDGKMKWGRMEDYMVEKGGRKGYITEKNGRSSWEHHGIIAFCTCQWNEMNTNILRHTGFPPKTNFLDLLVLTVGTYSEGNLLVVYEIRRQVLPTAPSPTTTHLMVCIVEGYLYCTSICNRTKNATN